VIEEAVVVVAVGVVETEFFIALDFLEDSLGTKKFELSSFRTIQI